MFKHTKVVKDGIQTDAFELEFTVDDVVRAILDYWAIEEMDECIVDLARGVVIARYSTVHHIPD